MKKNNTIKLYGFVLMVMLGIVYSYSVFRLNLEDEVGVSTVYSGFPYMFKLLFFSLSMGLGGYLFRKLGSKVIALAGSAFVVVGFFISYLAGFAETENAIVIMTLGYGLFIGLGIGPLYMLPLRVLSSNLDKHIGLWTGITLFGIGVSPMLFSPMVTYLFDYFSIFQVFLILGISYALILPVLTIKLANNDKTVHIEKHENVSVLKNKHFYIVYALFFIIMFIGLMFIGLAANIGVHVYEIELHVMAFFIGLFSIFNGLGRPLAGTVIDKISIFKTSVISFISILLIVGLAFWRIDSHILYLVFMGVVYLNFGAWLSIAPITTRRLFGAEHYTKHYGYMFSAYGISAFVVVWLSSYIFEMIGLNGLYVITLILLSVGLIITIMNRKVLRV